MPWTHTDPMSERAKFVLAYYEVLRPGDARPPVFSMTELCQRFGISRKTGYKWLQRYQTGGLAALDDRSRAPHACPHRTPEPLAEALVALRRAHPRCGARKLLVVLERRQPELVARFGRPAPSTVTALLHRHGLIPARRRRRRAPHPGVNALQADQPNAVWTADFKGEFRLGTGRYCYPLTICDAHSRYVLRCQGLPSTAHRAAKRVFTGLFREQGLPRVIRTDNGVPFATQGLRGLSRLSVYFIQLGIVPVRITPGRPQENGRHERMHRTLKAATARPPARTMAQQQARFDGFRTEYNHERPHEALAMQVPAACYAASPRPLPRRLPGPVYAGHLEVRRVDTNGCIKWRGHPVFLTTVLSGAYVGLEEIAEAIWSVIYYDIELGRYDAEHKQLYT